MKLTAGSWAEEKERPEGVNAKGRWGEHEAGKEDAALPPDSLQMQMPKVMLSLILSDCLQFLGVLPRHEAFCRVD